MELIVQVAYGNELTWKKSDMKSELLNWSVEALTNA